MSPYLVRRMIEWLSETDFDWREGFAYAIGLGTITAIKIYGFRRSTFFVCYN